MGTEAAPVVVEPSKPPTAEELQQRADETYASMGWGKAPKVEEGTPPPVVEPEPVVVAAPAPEPVVVAEPAKPVVPQASPDMATIVKAAASEGVRIAMTELPATARVATAPASQKPPIELTSDDQKDYDVIKFLERTDAKYKGKSAAYIEYVKANYAYQDDWGNKNSGREFNPNDPEHSDWYDKHQSPVTVDEIDDGREKMVEERIYNNRVKPELDRMNSERAIQQAMPTVIGNVHRKILMMVESVNPEIAKILMDASGNPSFTKEALAKADDFDPITFVELNRKVKQELEPLLVELEKSAVQGATYRLDPTRNPIHAAIGHHVARVEAEMSSKPASERIRNGRSFLSIADYQRMSTNILNSDTTDDQKNQQLNDLDARYYCLDVDEIEDALVIHCAAEVKKAVDFLDGTAKRKYKPSTAVGQPAVVTPAVPSVGVAPSTPSTKPKAPSSAGGNDVVQTSHLGNQAPKSFADQMAETHYRK